MYRCSSTNRGSISVNRSRLIAVETLVIMIKFTRSILSFLALLTDETTAVPQIIYCSVPFNDDEIRQIYRTLFSNESRQVKD